MSEYKQSTYRVWLIIFAIVFILSFLQGIFGLRALIGIIVRNPEVINTELFTLIRSAVIVLVNAVLAVATVVLSIRTARKRSSYQVWFLIIAIGFTLKFALGLITGINAFNILSPHRIAGPYKFDYYTLIGCSLITLIYGVFAVVSTVLSRRTVHESSGIS